MAVLWKLTDIVGISDRGWRRVSAIAWVVGLLAVAVGFVMVVAYAASVAINATMLGTDAAAGLARKAFDAANITVGVTQVLVAGMLQLGTDFGLLFAAGLAKAQHRITPTAALLLWGICAWNTIEMEIGLYSSLRDGRIEKLQEAADVPPPTVAAAIAALAPFQDGDGDGKPDTAPPDAIAASNAAIVQANQALADLAAEKLEKQKVRDDEERTGRKERWQASVDRIAAIDAAVVAPRAAIAAARKAIAQRTTYDANLAAVDAWKNRPKITTSGLTYDSDLAIWLRTFGLQLLALISILVAFAADLAGDLAGGGRAPRQPREPKPSAPPPRRRSGEAAGVRERGLPFFKGATEGPTPEATPRPSTRHPDRAGDNYGPRADGHAKPTSSGEDE